MGRIVEPELLDDLPATDPRAVASRGDLRRLNRIMGHAGILTRAARTSIFEPVLGRRLRVVDLGAGDGSFALEVARRWSALGVLAEITLIDRQNLLSSETSGAFEALHWQAKAVATDVFAWLEQPAPPVDILFANLFLHHFDEARLRGLLALVAARANFFLACEPRRSSLALNAARSIGLIGCNAVTRHDAVISVRAGFADRELSALWPARGRWAVGERSAGLFSHCFMARRNG